MLRALRIALSTYTVLPVGHFDWTEHDMRLSIGFLPVAGLPAAAALLGWHWLCVRINASVLFFSAVAAAIPILVSGGIHMDGLIDTADAVCSRRDRETRLAILKDPHVGAFGLLGCCLCLLLSAGGYAELFGRGAVALAAIGFLLSRAGAVLLMLLLPPAKAGGMLGAFLKDCNRPVAMLAALSILFAGGGLLLYLNRITAAAMLLGGLLFSLWFGRMALRQFGGITGDIAGCFIMLCELVLLYCAALGGCLQ